MTIKLLPLFFVLPLFTTTVRADTTVMLVAVDPARQDRRVDPKDDFVVEIRNDSRQRINIAPQWQVHVLFVDGKRYQLMGTGWWCLDSPELPPGAIYRRSMHLNFYSGLSLEAGVHKIQMEFGSVLSNKIQITTTEARRGVTTDGSGAPNQPLRLPASAFP